jgi:hypothetical protein
MTSLSNKIAELILVAHDLRIVNYFRGRFVAASLMLTTTNNILVACLTWLLYDMVLTINAEVKLACNFRFHFTRHVFQISLMRGFVYDSCENFSNHRST